MAKQRWRCIWSWIKADVSHLPLEDFSCGQSSYFCLHSAIKGFSQLPWMCGAPCEREYFWAILFIIFRNPNWSLWLPCSIEHLLSYGLLVCTLISLVLAVPHLRNGGIRESVLDTLLPHQPCHCLLTWWEPGDIRGSVCQVLSQHPVSLCTSPGRIPSPSWRGVQGSERVRDLASELGFDPVWSQCTCCLDWPHHAVAYSFVTLGMYSLPPFCSKQKWILYLLSENWKAL